MRIFVSEYVSSGAWPDGMPPDSLAREGASMLAAILTDFARIDCCRIVTTWDVRLGAPPALGSRKNGVEVVDAANPLDELQLFTRLVKECDATFVIAPEFDGILTNRSRIVAESGKRLIGPTPAAVELCADKFALATHLETYQVPTIPTRRIVIDDIANVVCDADLPVVVKPRYGAGSLDVRLISNRQELERMVATYHQTASTRPMIVQPHIAGTPLSVSAIVSPDQERIDVFPAGLQTLSDDGRFQYLGGSIPHVDVDSERVRTLLNQTIRTIPGLHGYVGFDLIQTPGRRGELLVCEINPRLTTSYLGYRTLTDENLAERILVSGRTWKPIVWKRGSVSFQPDGRCTANV